MTRFSFETLSGYLKFMFEADWIKERAALKDLENGIRDASSPVLREEWVDHARYFADRVRRFEKVVPYLAMRTARELARLSRLDNDEAENEDENSL